MTNVMTKTQVSASVWLILAVVAVVLVTYVVKRLGGLKQKLASINNSDTAKMATLYNSAMNPSGFAYLRSVDGTDEDTIFALAEKGKFDEVSRNYRNKYGRELSQDLADELSTTALNKFYATLKD